MHRLKLLFLLSAVQAGLAGLLVAQSAPAAGEPAIGGVPVSSLARSTLSTERDTYWVGELFTVTHRVSGQRRSLQGLAGAYQWNPSAFNADEWSGAVASTESSPNGDVAVYTQTTRGYARAAGTIELPRGTQPVTLVTGLSSSGVPGQVTTDTFPIRSAAAQFTVRPLPAPPPAAFEGAVGDFTLKATITATEVAVGEAVTWTLELAGTGNWPEIRGLPPRAVSRDFDVVTPAARPSFARGTLFEGSLTEDILLLPTKEGTYRLGPVKFTYFDPKIGRYQVLTSETFILKVGGGGSGLAPETDETAESAAALQGVPVPEAPPPVPLDPLDGPLDGIAPFSRPALETVVVAPLAGLLVFWLGLAVRRSHLTDPLRPQRLARNEMKAIFAQLEHAAGKDAAAVRRLLFSWQRAAGRLGELHLSEPTSAQVATAIEKKRRGATGAAWIQLWREANRVLYGENKPLPADWTARARAALAAAPVPAVPVFATFFKRNLLPFLGCLALLLAPGAVRADEGAEAYQRGDFAAAEAAWKKASAADPADAHLRYNLALVYAQQDRWTESVAQALSAFVLEPRNPAIRWQFNLSVTRAGIDQPVFADLASGRSFNRVARMLSPGGWGLALGLAAFTLALAGGLYLWAAYHARSRRMRWSAALLAVLALGAGLAAFASLRNYGQLADRSIAVVSRHTRLCSIPNEADITQKTSPLPAGSLATVTRVFLGWSQVSFPNGQTGWVRTDALTYLYK